MNNDKKTHATWSPSGAYRWLHCTGFPLIYQDALESKRVAPEVPSDSANDGTEAHELAEKALNHYAAAKLGHRHIPTRQELEAMGGTFENITYVESYVQYVDSLNLESILVESHVDIAPGCYGTVDCCGVTPEGNVHVVDFKFGKGVRVEVQGNPQLQLYAYGVLQDHVLGQCNDKPLDVVALHIFQPRIDNVGTWETTVADLQTFMGKVESAMDKATLRQVTAGEWCRWCKLEGLCRGAMKANYQDTPTPPELMGEEELAVCYAKVETLKTWCNAVEEQVKTDLMAGRDIPGYMLTKTKGRRSWKDGCFQDVLTVLGKEGLKVQDFMDMKLCTITKAQKLMGKDFQPKLGEFLDTSEGSPKVVPADSEAQPYDPMQSARADFTD
jgi:hypothetical protein